MTNDPRLVERETCVTRYLLHRWDRECPDKIFAVFEDGETWTYKALLEKVLPLASGLASIQIKQGDHVAVWLFDSKKRVDGLLGQTEVSL